MRKSFLNLFYDFSLKIDDFLTKIFFEIFSSVTHVFQKKCMEITYDRKEYYKSMGCKWDAVLKKWYTYNGCKSM